MLLNNQQKSRWSLSDDGVVVRGPNKGVSTTSKMHHCPFCAYTTNKTTNLNNHVRVHTGEKPFVCPHCPYRATQETTLKFHIRTHTGEKPYACTYCSYRSIKVSTLRRHMQTHQLVG
ncbi:hypothetical protein Pmani_017857 [Petrolisthes manimaculis]|uniref:C2H2-type domain-containing protein n=1 Tax=Petrolisthes manimaculis TaxID=1843537 RepID=A0AAE1PNX6_9EUCA|nr:hypothetical protein Pmani_017857 [Petrolisthes manimaculis]